MVVEIVLSDYSDGLLGSEHVPEPVRCEDNKAVARRIEAVTHHLRRSEEIRWTDIEARRYRIVRRQATESSYATQHFRRHLVADVPERP